jgi:hypothetical protein
MIRTESLAKKPATAKFSATFQKKGGQEMNRFNSWPP